MNYKLLFSNNESITSSWNTIFSNIYNRRDDLTNNKTYASLDDSLVGYWDMETLTWTLLKDLSKYHNDWTCYNWATPVTCWTAWSWPQIVAWNWKTWKAMNFDGVDDWVDLWNSSYLQFVNNYTILFFLKINTQQNTYFVPFSKWHTNSSWMVFQWNISNPNSFVFAFPWIYGFNYTYNNIVDNNNFLSIQKSSISWLKLWLNGVKIKENTSLNWNIYTNTYNLSLWKDTINSGRNFNWIIDEVRIYNRALSDSEIRELYNATK